MTVGYYPLCTATDWHRAAEAVAHTLKEEPMRMNLQHSSFDYATCWQSEHGLAYAAQFALLALSCVVSLAVVVLVAPKAYAASERSLASCSCADHGRVVSFLQFLF